jgi:hypothetical protein
VGREKFSVLISLSPTCWSAQHRALMQDFKRLLAEKDRS